MRLDPVLFFRAAVLTATLLFASGKASSGRLMIVASGESHGMLEACNCKDDPGGGMAKRSSLLASLGDRSNVLLLDAGGFSAGGIYDDYTEGRSGDSIRTGLMIAAMGLMRYDAAAIGDDDLQYGGEWLVERARESLLPLVSANCFQPDKRPLAAPYLIAEKAGIRIGITAVCSAERLFAVDPRVTVVDPVAALRGIWKELSKQSDVQIILSHLGQEKSAALIRAFPDCDLVVNGHRKSDKRPIVMTGATPMMQFGFQGKSLSAINLSFSEKKPAFGSGRWLDIVPELPDDPRIAELAATRASAGRTENSYDLYIMSQCQYGLEALSDFLAFANGDQSVRWDLWFIGSVENDSSLSSLHGNDEVLDEMRWLAIRELYPEKWELFLRRRTASSEPTMLLAEKAGCDPKKIDRWVASEGAAALQRHYFRSMRLSVDASPTLLVNNRPFGRNINQVNLRRFHCETLDSPSPRCDSLPQCAEDFDCRAPGKIGTCKDGKCEFREAVPFAFTVVIADSAVDHPEEKVIKTTVDLFPGADVRVIGMGSRRGKGILKQYEPDALPFYLFGKEVELAHNFSSLRGRLVDLGTAYSFSEGVVRPNYYPKRKRIPGNRRLFIDPFFPELQEIFRFLASDSLAMKKIIIEPAIYADPSAVRPGTEERFRQEEALRWIVLEKVSPSVRLQYLEAYAARPGTSLWPALLPSSFPADSLLSRMSDYGGLLYEQWKTVKSLEVREPVVLLIDNVETVPIKGERELRRILLQKKR